MSKKERDRSNHGGPEYIYVYSEKKLTDIGEAFAQAG